MQILLNVYFTAPNGEQKQDWIFLNRDRPKQWVTYCAYIGTTFTGDTDDITTFFGPSGIYLYDSGAVIARVNGIASGDITVNIGDKGTGTIYRGTVPYPRPIDFSWECVPVPTS
jgi:hypothetical protein